MPWPCGHFETATEPPTSEVEAAYQQYLETFSGSRWAELSGAGALAFGEDHEDVAGPEDGAAHAQGPAVDAGVFERVGVDFAEKFAEGAVEEFFLGEEVDFTVEAAGDGGGVEVAGVAGDEEDAADVTQEALRRGIAEAVVGRRLGDIGHAVQSTAEAAGFTVVRDLVGHGIGREPHEDPQVPNYGQPGRGPRLEEGLVIAIEPMLNAGVPEVRTLPDRWTVVTADRRRSAHFEHTVAVTAAGPRILTARGGDGRG